MAGSLTVCSPLLLLCPTHRRSRRSAPSSPTVQQGRCSSSSSSRWTMLQAPRMWLPPPHALLQLPNHWAAGCLRRRRARPGCGPPQRPVVTSAPLPPTAPGGAKLLLQFAGSVVVVCRQTASLVALCPHDVVKPLLFWTIHCPSSQGDFSTGGGSRRPVPACLRRHQGSSWGAACNRSRRRW